MRSTAAELETPDAGRVGDANAAPVLPMLEHDREPATTTTEMVRRCRRIADSLGADGFSMLFLAKQGEMGRLVPVFDSGFPGITPFSRGLSSRAADVLAQAAVRDATPICWQAPEALPFLADAAGRWVRRVEVPLESGAAIVLPVSFEKVRSGLLAFHGEAMHIDEALLCESHARSFALFADVVRQRMNDAVKTPMVSKRETECLRLTAGGLTSDDIAASLGLSVHTANQYLTNSTHKLNAVNRIHAVAKALRSGLID
jgi:DNA-binding CsgD family transcriptional regulator